MTTGPLPVESALDDLRAALRAERGAVLVAPPGAGKTTVVPLALRSEAWLNGRKIVMLEPRRLATRAAAARMARTLGESPGETVGYRIRRDTRVGASTCIEVVTEGVLTRMLQSDPSLEEVGLVVFDEYHERSVHADLGLALALESRRLFREDLRILVMSATLDAEPVARLLGDVPVVEAHGRSFPVETRYLESSAADPVDATAQRVLVALPETNGDVLAFLPGVGEIRRVERGLTGRLPAATELFPLYGNLSRDRQDRAIAPSPPDRRKVVLATAIAQTSLTIEGVKVVVDSGLMRVPRFDPATGMTGLETLRVTEDVAEQRRGRAGRVAPGVCYRLWTRSQQNALVPAMRPEILEADLANMVLELAVWGVAPEDLAWLDAPPTPALAEARRLLVELDALDEGGAPTAHGRQLVKLGAHPRLAHMLIRGREFGMGPLACDLAALLGERDILRRPGGASDTDMRLRVECVRSATAGGHRNVRAPRGHDVLRGPLHRVLEEARHSRAALGLRSRTPAEAAAVDRTGELLALAYPDRLGQVRGGSSRRAGVGFVLRNGRGAALPADDSLAASDWIVASDLDDRDHDARIFRAAPLTRETVEELFGHQIDRTEQVEWDDDAGRVQAWRHEGLGALTLRRERLRDPSPERVREALVAGLRRRGLDALPWTRRTLQLRERLLFMHAVDPETWPDTSEDALLASLEVWLGPFLDDKQRLDDLRKVDLGQALWTYVGWPLRPKLDELAPTHLEVPSGSRIPVDYSDPQAPALAVRLQEVFGWLETPRLAGGRIPITLRLLSPAQRPVQVTSDLASFWRSGYFEVKKDLKGRYPKHYWPEDPLTATPTRRVRPKPKDSR